MWNLIKKYNLEIFSIIMVVIAIITFIQWTTVSYARHILGIYMILLTLHEWEETRYPGGFYEFFLKKLGGDKEINMDMNLMHFLVAVLLLVYTIPSYILQNFIFLTMMPVTFGILESIMHTAGIFIHHTGKPYTPGLISALLMLAWSIYALVTGISAGIVRISDIIIGIVLMLVLFLIMEQTALHIAGVNPNDYFQKMVRGK